MQVSKPELKIFSAVGINAGQVAFATLIASVFGVDKLDFILVIFALVLVVIFWGSSWYLARRYQA
jgi:hypothetical protein